MRRDGSVTRQLADALTGRLTASQPDATLTRRDLADNAPAFIDESWIGATSPRPTPAMTTSVPPWPARTPWSPNCRPPIRW